MQPEYMLYCEACGHKVLQHINMSIETGAVSLDCEYGHVNNYHIVELVQCFTEHCEDTDDAETIPSNPNLTNS